jgi:hypothetical protein
MAVIDGRKVLARSYFGSTAPIGQKPSAAAFLDSCCS